MGSSGSLLNGVFGGIDFGTGQWRWEGPYNVSNSNHIYFASTSGTSRPFRFAGAAQILTAFDAFATRAGTLRISDDTGQTRSLSLPTGAMVAVATGWTRPSSVITVNFSAGSALGVDNISYRPSTGTPPPPDTAAPSVQITQPASGTTDSATPVAVNATVSDNVGVAGVQFQIDGQNLGAEDTTAPYSTTLNPATHPAGDHLLTAIARDAAGNRATSASVRVVVAAPPRAAQAVPCGSSEPVAATSTASRSASTIPPTLCPGLQPTSARQTSRSSSGCAPRQAATMRQR